MSKQRLSGLGTAIVLLGVVAIASPTLIQPLAQAVGQSVTGNGSPATQEVAEAAAQKEPKNETKLISSTSEVAEAPQKAEGSVLEDSPEAGEAKASADTYTAFADARRNLAKDPENQSLKTVFSEANTAYEKLKKEEEEYDKANPCPEQEAYEKKLNAQGISTQDRDGEPSTVKIRNSSSGKDEG